jgi:hypothetical protein
MLLPGCQDDTQELLGGEGPWSTLRWKSKADSSSKGQKYFICGEEKGKAEWGHAEESGKHWSPVSGWKLSFKACFIAQGQRFWQMDGRGSVSLVQTDVSWEEVSPWLIVTFWDLLQSALQLDLLRFSLSTKSLPCDPFGAAQSK